MADDDLVYSGRDRKRPPGASDFVQRIYGVLDEHPAGMTRDELLDAMLLEGGEAGTDAYRAYDQYLDRRRKVSGEIGGARRLQYGSDAFKRRAQRWYLTKRLAEMQRSATARREGDRWYTGRRPLRVRAAGGRYAPLDSAAQRARDRATMREFTLRERIKARQWDDLNDSKVTRARLLETVRLSYEYLCGRLHA